MTVPTHAEWNHMFQTYAVCTLILFVKYLGTAVYAVDQDNHPEEDKKILGEKKNPEDIKRRSRVFGNDLENIPFHMSIFWGAFIVQCFSNLSGHGQSETLALTALVAIYSALRVGYTITYIFAVQPLRSICFVLANLTVLTTTIIMVVSAFKVDTSRFSP